MTVGYPDYARLSEQGGFQLFGQSGTIQQNAQLFAGYVGSWPYINVSSIGPNTANNARIAMQYYSDSTFTTEVGFRYAVRTQASFAQVQYANLSPWLIFSYLSDTGVDLPWEFLGVYGVIGLAPQTELASLDVPIYSTNQTIAANTTMQAFPQHIQPGPGVVNVSIGTNTWFVNIFAWNYTSNAWVLDTQLIGSWAGNGGIFDVPMLDVPYRIDLHNSGTAPVAFNFSWKST